MSAINFHSESDINDWGTETSAYYCQTVPKDPEPFRDINALDDLLAVYPDRAQLICQQQQHFSSRLRLAALRPRGVYGPGLLANALPHQTKSFCLHQPLPPLPLHDAHKYHQFTLVDLLQRSSPKDNDDRIQGGGNASENILEGSNFFAALASGANTSTAEKASKTAAATIASFILSAAPAPAIAPHAFRRVPLQQPAKVHSAVSRASLPQQQLLLLQGQNKTGSTVGGSSRVASRAPSSVLSSGSALPRHPQQQWAQNDRWIDTAGHIEMGDARDDSRRQKRRKFAR